MEISNEIPDGINLPTHIGIIMDGMVDGLQKIIKIDRMVMSKGRSWQKK